MTIEIVEGDLPSTWLQAAIRASIVGTDIETSGLDRIKDRIACIQIHVPNTGTIMVRWLDKKPTNILTLLNSWRVTKIFQFAPFDLSFLRRDYPDALKPTQIVDTKIAAKILDPKRELFIDPDTNMGSHSLKALVWHYFEDKLNKDVAVSNWFAETLSKEQLAYAAKDVEVLPPLLSRLENDIIDKDPALVHKLVREYNKLTTEAVFQAKYAA